MAGKRGRRKKVETVAEQSKIDETVEETQVISEVVEEQQTPETIVEETPEEPKVETATDINVDASVEEQKPVEDIKEESLKEIIKEETVIEEQPCELDSLPEVKPEDIVEETPSESNEVLPKIEESVPVEPIAESKPVIPETITVPADNTMIQISKIISELKKNPMYRYLAKTTLIRIAHKRIKKNTKFLNA